MYAANKDFASKVTIAKVDATTNDVPDDIKGFPTIKLFPAGAKTSPIEYSGDRTIDDLAKFVAENGKWKIDVLAGKTPKKSEGEEAEMPDAEEMGKAAPAATETGAKVEEAAAETASETEDTILSTMSEVVEAVKTAMVDSDGDKAEHDEL